MQQNPLGEGGFGNTGRLDRDRVYRRRAQAHMGDLQAAPGEGNPLSRPERRATSSRPLLFRRGLGGLRLRNRRQYQHLIQVPHITRLRLSLA